MAKLSSVFNREIAEKTVHHPKKTTKWIHYTKLKASKYQYCDAKEKEEIESLADSIEAIGEVLENLLVRKTDTDEYEILGGHKRCAACRLLVEERGREDFAFLPCNEKKESEARSHFMVLASNIHHIETPYEKMHKLTTMKNLIENYPEEFPDVQKGRMVERLARMCDMKKTTVGEYLSIAKNLGDDAMEAFKEGRVEKSAAVTLAGMPKDTQRHVLELGITTDAALKEYKKENMEPGEKEILLAYDYLRIAELDRENRKEVAGMLSGKYRNVGMGYPEFCFGGRASNLVINGKTITWSRFGQLLDKYRPYTSQEKKHISEEGKKLSEQQIAGQMEIVDTEMGIKESRNVPESGMGEARQESGKEDTVPEKERLFTVKEVPGCTELYFDIEGRRDRVFLFPHPAEQGIWCCYQPSCEHGCNLSDSDKDANGKKLFAVIQEPEVCCAVNEAVWDILHPENGRPARCC